MSKEPSGLFQYGVPIELVQSYKDSCKKRRSIKLSKIMAEAADQQEPPEETLGTDGGEEIVRVYQNGVEVRNRRRYEGFRLTRTLSSTGDGSWVLNVSGHRAGRISRVLYGFVVNIDTTVSRRSGNELTIRDDNLKVVIEFRDPGSTNRVARQLEWQVLQQRAVADRCVVIFGIYLRTFIFVIYRLIWDLTILPNYIFSVMTASNPMCLSTP